MALIVDLTGIRSIVQGEQITIQAVTTNAEGTTLSPSGLTYAWSASQGSFVGATDQASVVYHADFTENDNVDVVIRCVVTLPANPNPTSSGASLTALSEIGVTGVLVNMFMTALGAIVSNSNNALYQDGGVGTLETGSDQALSSDITVWRITVQIVSF